MGNFDRYSMLDGRPLCNVGGWHFDADIVHWIPCVLLFCSLEGATMVTGKSSSCQYLALLWKHDFWILLTWLSLSYFNIQIIVKITLFQPDVSQKTQQNEVFWWTTFDLTCHGSVWWHFLVVCCSLFLRSLQPIRQNCSCWCYLVPTSTQTSMNRIFFKEKMSCEIDWVKFVSPRLHSLMLTSLFIQGYFKPWKAPALNLIDSCSQFLFVSLLSIGLGGVERTNTAESESVLLLVGSVVCTLLTLMLAASSRWRCCWTRCFMILDWEADVLVWVYFQKAGISSTCCGTWEVAWKTCECTKPSSLMLGEINRRLYLSPRVLYHFALDNLNTPH